MEIADYIPNYPELNDPNFNNNIFHKKEFYELRTMAEPQPFGKPGDLWNHQKLLARFLSPYTPYNELLLFHTPGTGKTCASAAIIEINKIDKLLRKPALIIVPNETLATQWKKQIALVCTSGQYVPENYYSVEPDKKLTSLEKTTRLNKALRRMYRVRTMEKMRRLIDSNTDHILKRDYSNRIIIIDEAHNLRIQTNTTQKNIQASRGRYNAYHRFLHLITNSKVVLLTGTPMFDRASELPGLMNLILPINKQLPSAQQFMKKYVQNGVVKNSKDLFQLLQGRVSYIREGGNFPKRIDLGDTLFTKFIKTVNLKMSPTQIEGYKLAVKKDSEQGVAGLLKNSRQAAVFVYKKEQRYYWGTDASNLLTTKSRRQIKIKIKGRDVSYHNYFIKPEYQTDLKNNISNYSAKYNYILQYLKQNRNKPTFIFTPLVSGGGGAIFLSLILGINGYGKAVGNERQPALRYALITGEDKSNTQRDAIIDIFNSRENKDGSIIQVLIASMTISVGTNFTNVQEEIVVSPYWNNSGTVQAIGRGLRANSLLHLERNERKVTVQQLAVIGDSENNNVDMRLYKMSEDKDIKIKVLERALKQSAWDCALNYDRNVREIDEDNSRECDYQQCNYICAGITPIKTSDKWRYEVKNKHLIKDTYILYYAREEMLQIVERIKHIFRKKSYININGLDKLLKPGSFKLLVLSIKYMIENHITVYNKWGQSTFLRKEGNMLFLSDIPTEDSILGSWYSTYPYVNVRNSLTTIINNELLKDDLDHLDNFDPESENAQKIIDKLSLETQLYILEKLFELENNPKNEAFKLLFNDYIFDINGTLVHDLQKVKLDINYTDFNRGDGGTLRCFDNNVWRDCTKKEEDEYSTKIKQLKENKNIDIINKQLYGILTNDGKFQIADRTKDTKTTDNRTKHKGRVCGTWQKWQLIEIYFRLQISPSEQLIAENDEAKLKDIIKRKNVEKAVPDNPTINDLKIVATLAENSNSQLCTHLQQEFEKKNLLLK